LRFQRGRSPSRDERRASCTEWAAPERPFPQSRERLAQGLIRRRAGRRPSGNARDNRAVVTPMIERIALIGPSPVLRDVGRTAVGCGVKLSAEDWQGGMTRAITAQGSEWSPAPQFYGEQPDGWKLPIRAAAVLWSSSQHDWFDGPELASSKRREEKPWNCLCHSLEKFPRVSSTGTPTPDR
jgi:hypothetical protein